MQPCPKCGSAVEANAKFCRNCGAHMFNESTGSEAQTQHYGRQTPPPAPEPASAPFTSQIPNPPPSIADTFAPDTGRLHYPNAAANPPLAGAPPPMPYQQNQYPAPAYGQPPATTAPKSNWWKWALGGVLGCVLICGGCITVGLYKAQQMGQGLQQKVETAIADAKRQAETEAAKQAAPVIGPDGVPVPPPAPPAPGSDNASPSLSALKYPNAQQKSTVKAMGQEVVTLTSDDAWDDIKAFYQKALGDPMVETNQDDGDKNVVFQKGATMVTLQPSKTATGKTDITLINSGFLDMLKKKVNQ